MDSAKCSPMELRRPGRALIELQILIVKLNLFRHHLPRSKPCAVTSCQLVVRRPMAWKERSTQTSLISKCSVFTTWFCRPCCQGVNERERASLGNDMCDRCRRDLEMDIPGRRRYMSATSIRCSAQDCEWSSPVQSIPQRGMPVI